MADKSKDACVLLLSLNSSSLNLLYRLESILQAFQMDNWELHTLGQNIDMELMKGYLDGDAI